MSTNVAVIGGGLTGLSAAYYISKEHLDWQIDVFEQDSRFGGKIKTKRMDGYVVEVGPDSYLARKTELTDLIKELGLGDTIVSNATGQAYIYDRGRMYPIPGGSIIGIPTEFIPFVTAKLLSWFGKIRAGMDIFKTPYKPDGDVSIGDFFLYHLGEEMVDKLIEPLLSGIYGGNIFELSLDATFPEFHTLEKQQGNMVKAMLYLKTKQPSRKSGGNSGMFRQLTGGLDSVIESLVAQMPENVSFHVNAKVDSLLYNKEINTYKIGTSSMTEKLYDKVVITTPPHSYKDWFPGDEEIKRISEMQQSSCAIAIMAFNKDEFDAELEGTGFVITRKTDTPLTACTYISKKWPTTTPDDKVVLRVFLGKAGDTSIDDLEEDDLKKLALKEIRRIIGFTAAPIWTEMVQLKKSMPQYVVGHRELVNSVQEHISHTYPNLYAIGTPFDGVGMPDGVKQAKTISKKIT